MQEDRRIFFNHIKCIVQDAHVILVKVLMQFFLIFSILNLQKKINVIAIQFTMVSGCSAAW